ncbi:hypothetical protein B7463_g9867, partial [Scytalidium lignicola]
MPSASAKQRGPKRGTTSRTARLEEKLDDVVALLRGRQVPATPNQSDNANTGFELDDGADSPPTSLVSTPSMDQDYPEGPSPVEADESFTRFREEMIASGFLLVHLATYPFLWLNIMGVASKSIKTRNSLSLQTRCIIIERIVAGGERSLDLLYGVLTFVNWVHLFPMDKQFASLASQLAVSLVCDLGLQMPPPMHPPIFSPDINAAGRPRESFRKGRTVEEQRAVLGAFIITSMLSQTFKSADGLRWSPHLDEYLVNISHHSTVPQDKVLVREVKMQLIVNQFRYSSWKINNAEIPMAWVDMLQLQLDEITSAMSRTSSTFGNESALLGFYYYTTLTIREWIMVKSSIPKNEPDFKRYEITTARDASWNLAAAKEAVDPLQIVDRIIHTFEQVKAAADTHSPSSEEDQALLLGIKKFQAFKSAWQRELAAQDKGKSPVQETEIPDGSQTPLLTDPLDSFSFYILPDILNGSTIVFGAQPSEEDY